MGLIKWRYIWRYVTEENIKNIVKTVGYPIYSVEPVATIYTNDLAQSSLLLVITLQGFCGDSQNFRSRAFAAQQLQTTS